MATTVRVEGDVKGDLDRLQGTVQSARGERLTHSQLLRRLLQFARRREEEFLADPPDEWTPPTRAEIALLLSGVRDWGIETDASRIDEDLYGSDAALHGGRGP